MPRRTPDAPIRITTAASSAADDLRMRQRRYLLSMSLRTLCFIGAFVSFLAGVRWLWPFLIGGAVVLPYIAVVMANAVNTRADDYQLRDADDNRHQLPSGHTS